MSAKPGYLKTLEYGGRWGIEAMFSDFKSRGFGVEDTHIHYPKRLGRLLLVMALALHWAVSTGLWDACHYPTPSEKRPETSAQESRARQNILVHPWHPTHRQNPPNLPLPPLWGYGKLMDGKGARVCRLAGRELAGGVIS